MCLYWGLDCGAHPGLLLQGHQLVIIIIVLPCTSRPCIMIRFHGICSRHGLLPLRICGCFSRCLCRQSHTSAPSPIQHNQGVLPCRQEAEREHCARCPAWRTVVRGVTKKISSCLVSSVALCILHDLQHSAPHLPQLHLQAACNSNFEQVMQ